MVNAWLNTVKEVQAKVPKGTLLKDILHKAKIIYEKKIKKRQKEKVEKEKLRKSRKDEEGKKKTEQKKVIKLI